MKYYLHLLLVLFGFSLQAQNSVQDMVLRHLEEHKDKWQLTSTDLQNPVITDEYTSRHNGVTHLYMRQTHAGIEVYNGIINANVFPDGRVLGVSNRFVANLSEQINATTASIGILEAVQAGVRDLEIQIVEPFFIQSNNTPNEYEISDGGIAAMPIKAKLMYLPMPENEVRLIWQFSIYTKNRQHSWEMSVDAINGQILKKRDAVLHCDFGTPHEAHAGCKGGDAISHISGEKSNLVSNAYNVYPFPIESPIHGERALLLNPADSLASPFGWHDTDGEVGPEHTHTQGNNVLATEDRNDNGGIGHVAEGGDSLVFDFPLDFSLSPLENQDASITNLFYWNNIMHDVWYQYGFDEVSGNFQENNYGRGGIDGDYVLAETQDGSGTNNATFFSPGDGSNGQMQMFLWSPSAGDLIVNEPMDIAGTYNFGGASFGPSIFDVTGTVVEAFDASAEPTLVCEAVDNVDEVSGNIAMIERQTCTFVEKVLNAQNAGAIAVIMCNNEPTGVVQMGGTDNSITIPSVMLSNQDCAMIRAQLSEGVQVTMQREDGFQLDSGFDNGVIVHEYGHGVSIRLTGGPNNSGCLSNDQQMGEGWSDWLGLVMSPVSDTDGTIPRGIGTFLTSGETDGAGIRTFRYSTDMGINPHTYADIPGETVPHGVGSIWCAMIWDLYWALVDVHGFDDDLYNGTGGNNIAMQLVTDGMKMQACNPNFTDGRDAILLADEASYNGENRCLIWEVFARRGLGFSATSATVNAFDLHPFCIEPAPPVTDFSSNQQESCTGEIQFTDMTENFPTTWAWDFGDGNTSTEENPLHTYEQNGTYTVTLETSNDLGTDNETKMSFITVSKLEVPEIQEVITCEDGIARLTATTTNGTIEWLDNDGNIIGEGEILTAPPLSEPTTLQARSATGETEQIGPEDNSFGPGGYHNTGFRGQVFFEANEAFTLVSVLVDAGSPGVKQFDLETLAGEVIDIRFVNIQQGGLQRVDIGWEIAPGQYAMAAESVDLYRNEFGAMYPYEHPSGAVTLTGSSVAAGPDFYYYFYDWEVKTGCVSESVSVDVDCIFVGIEDNPAVETFNVFPNPNDGTFNMELVGDAEENIELTIFDVLGQAIYTDNYDFYSGELNTQIDLKNITSGTYIIKLAVRDRASYQKIVVY